MTERIVIADVRKEGRAALDGLEVRGRDAGLDEATVLELRVVAEEVLTNIAKYGFEPGAPAAAEVLFSVTGSEAVLEFRDHGRAFDPLAQAPPDLDAPPEERPLGGLGLPMIRGLVDEARYVREGATNVLRLVKRRAEQ